MTPTEINAVLDRIGGKANKRLGQHFLIEERTLRAIIEAAQIQSGDFVLEIGPGLGVLTEALTAAGARVTAIEQDRRFVEWFALKKDSYVKSGGEVSIFHGDAARMDWMSFVHDRPWKFVSNLPYSITSLALRKALWNTHPPERIAVLVQREVAERAIAQDGKGSLLSLMVALASREAKIVRRVPRGAFYPPPQVESAVLLIEPLSLHDRMERWGIDSEKIMALAKCGFAHPRKFLFSNLKNSKSSAFETAEVQNLISGNSGIDPKARAEDLTPDDWARLAKKIKFYA
ncbi:MAG TPA: 16S rRNA (adenine(1518)-N(6)/adenine(1519)-N(6))-dimethyltransferase RsmA [Patescibacteria group bacterium]|nr:16S rRNA (adenine(1518)-N(6)/adenine(1519)-N(6))-dimethyltransferase RsmA [Patescibacteria group bacterium]